MSGLERPEYVYIYALWDPLVNEPRYVGKAERPKGRYWQHLNAARNGDSHPKSGWIRWLMRFGYEPQLRIVMKVPHEGWKTFERNLIARYRSKGFFLYNISKGGNGFVPLTKEQVETKRKIMVERWRQPEYREKVVAALRISHDSYECSERISRSLARYWRDSGAHKLASERAIRRWQNEGYRVAQKEATHKWRTSRGTVERWHQGILDGWNSDKRREALTERNLQLWSDPEQKERWAAAIARACQMPENRQRISERMRARWNDPEERAKLIACRSPKTEEEKEAVAKKNRELWSDPEHREKRCRAISESWTPERKAAQAEKMREYQRRRREKGA